MKKLFPLIILAALVSFKTPTFHPPGTVQINDTLWYDETEVTNSNYKEFLDWVEKAYGRDSRQYEKALPDTLVWRKKLAYNEPYVVYYFRHPAYKNYPVAGINYYQANDYCKWRTEIVKEQMRKENKGKTFVFEYRLPSKAEWQAVALLGWNKKSKLLFRQGKLDQRTPWNLVYGKSKKHGDEHHLPDQADVTRPVNAGPANEKNIYNLFGNVAEMINEYGVSVGGGWAHGPDEAGFNNTIPYSAPESWLGFRCVCIVKNP
jgi:formylglycine-generating enzyme required for sulfatase activity